MVIERGIYCKQYMTCTLEEMRLMIKQPGVVDIIKSEGDILLKRSGYLCWNDESFQ